MAHQTATTARPRSIAERKASLADMVRRGAISGYRAKLIDFREPMARERAFAETLAPQARRFLASGKTQPA